MQNKCITHFVIIGNQTDIKFLHKNLQQAVNSGKTTISKVANTFCPQWANYPHEGYFLNLSKDNPRQITFTVHSISKPEPCLWFEICSKYQTTRCYYHSATVQSHHYTTNDLSGRYFPQRYMIVDAKGNQNPVVSHRDMFRQAARIVPISETFDTLEAFGKTLFPHLSQISIFDILVVDSRGKCVTPNPQLITQYLK
ncbi:MAG: hypothetical protein LBQ74_20160 [Prevotella sp.]|jgi:hypothetical protein|nr:hypothetical protein [Prevotella sp.]